MTYQVLARKWRPRNFEEIAGQDHVVKTLIHALENNRLHHAYLFTGARGVGKTTIARVLARCLNCEQGVTAKPCGQCDVCKEIDEGRFIDLLEVDAASRTKVEDTRELLENVQYAPSRGKFKVYLIDEVHMFSRHSFNALLKTLEEPPPHVKFLLATTDPQKLPVTVLSRCLQFNLKNVSPQRLVEHLKHILEQEQIVFEEPALWQLARAARGSVRDGLTLLDQAVSYCGDEIRDAEVRSFLGAIDQEVIQQLVDGLAAGDGARLLKIIDEAADYASDFTAVLVDLLSCLHRVAVAQVVPGGIDNSQGDRQKVLEYAKAIPAENIQLYYQIALKGREELPLAVDARAGLEMTLLRMLAFTPEGVPQKPDTPLRAPADAAQPEAEAPEVKKKPLKVDAVAAGREQGQGAPERQGSIDSEVDAVAAPVAGGEQSLGQKQQRGSIDSEIDATAPVAEGEQALEQIEQRDAVDSGSDAAAPTGQGEQALEQIEQSSAADSKVDAVADQVARTERISLEEMQPQKWIPLFYQLKLEGMTRNIAANGLLQSVSAERIVLRLDESQTSVFNEEHKRRIGRALNDYFGGDLRLEVEFGTVEAETPAVFRKRKERERQQRAVETFVNDDRVKAIVERFDGVIQKDTIEATTPSQY